MAAAMKRAVLDEAPFVAVLVVLAAGFCYMAAFPAHWLRGVVVLAAAMALAGVLRAVLTERRAGMLAVRSRVFDTLCYLALGVAIFSFGVALPR